MERDIKPTYDELESYVENLQKQLADAQATIAALQAVIRQMGEQAAVLAKDGMAAKAQVAALQARVRELEQWVQDQSTANLETMRHMDEMQSRAMDAEYQLTRRTAELEATKRERDHAKKMEVVQKEVADNQTWHVQQLRAELERVKQALCDADERANEYQKALHDFESERALPLSIELERVRGLVKTYAAAKIDFDDKRLQEDHHAWCERYTRLVGAETILIALTATSQEGQHGQ